MSSDPNSSECLLPGIQERGRADKEGTRPASDATTRRRKIIHYSRPLDRPFTAEERDRVTILFGGFTWKHEHFIAAILRGSGYRCQQLPTPDLAAFNIGREFGNNGQCNPPLEA
jgi:hypothetical protein